MRMLTTVLAVLALADGVRAGDCRPGLFGRARENRQERRAQRFGEPATVVAPQQAPVRVIPQALPGNCPGGNCPAAVPVPGRAVFGKP